MAKIKETNIPEAESDEAVMVRVQNGDVSAFQRIVARYERKLLLYITHLIGTGAEADDVLQNVFVKAYQYAGRFDASRTFSSWIYRIAHNEAQNWLRRRGRRRLIAFEELIEAGEETLLADDQPTAEESWIKNEETEAVRQALLLLPDQYREILTLRYFLEKSYQDIAEIIGIPPNTVATRLNRAKKKLAEAIEEGK